MKSTKYKIICEVDGGDDELIAVGLTLEQAEERLCREIESDSLGICEFYMMEEDDE